MKEVYTQRFFETITLEEIKQMKRKGEILRANNLLRAWHQWQIQERTKDRKAQKKIQNEEFKQKNPNYKKEYYQRKKIL